MDSMAKSMQCLHEARSVGPGKRVLVIHAGNEAAAYFNQSCLAGVDGLIQVVRAGGVAQEELAGGLEGDGGLVAPVHNPQPQQVTDTRGQD